MNYLLVQCNILDATIAIQLDLAAQAFLPAQGSSDTPALPAASQYCGITTDYASTRHICHCHMGPELHSGSYMLPRFHKLSPQLYRHIHQHSCIPTLPA